jgi:hypothetical protein
MIWLAFRRHRLSLIVMAGVLVVLGVWMAAVTHSFESALGTPPPHGCLDNLRACNLVFHGWDSAQQQAAVIDLVLFLVPCLFGVVLGAPLVAGELHERTNRVAWTQGISRTRWLVTNWLVVGLSAVALMGLFQLVVQWWSGHVLVNFLESHFILGTDRIAPRLFGVTGVVPIAYTLFAFALGVALGALLRHTVWAVVGTVAGYGLASLGMVVGIRSSLAAKVFVSETTIGGYDPGPSGAWYIGPEWRAVPGAQHPTGASVLDIVHRCMSSGYVPTYDHCLTTHGVEGGFLYQPLDHYWPIQGWEALIFVSVAVALFAPALWAVRRWRA